MCTASPVGRGHGVHKGLRLGFEGNDDYLKFRQFNIQHTALVGNELGYPTQAALRCTELLPTRTPLGAKKDYLYCPTDDRLRTMVQGELACGTPPTPGSQTLRDIALLQQSQQANLRETMDFIEREKLYGLGCGLVDLVLLASTMITPSTELWTLDKHLVALCERFGVMHLPAFQ